MMEIAVAKCQEIFKEISKCISGSPQLSPYELRLRSEAMNFVLEATVLEASTMNNFAHLLERVNVRQKEDFSMAVRYAIEYHRVPVSKFVDEFGVSPPTVSRWARGTSIPHLMARPRIINWITTQVQKRKAELEKQASTQDSHRRPKKAVRC